MNDYIREFCQEHQVLAGALVATGLAVVVGALWWGCQ
jgi:hypothetical protein